MYLRQAHIGLIKPPINGGGAAYWLFMMLLMSIFGTTLDPPLVEIVSLPFIVPAGPQGLEPLKLTPT